jgi:hypothetical protein
MVDAYTVRASQALVVIASLCASVSGGAYELTPLPTRTERLAAKRTAGITFRTLLPVVDFGLHTFSNSVHESLTNLAYECPGTTLEECSDADLDVASVGVIAGVRWNDDPPFQFAPGQGRYSGCPSGSPPRTISFALATPCWVAHFRDISNQADSSPKTFTTGAGTMLARTHFGDLQFLHAMAAAEGEPAETTKSKVMMWAQFAWRVQTHEGDRIDPGTPMGKVPVLGMQDHFPAKEERSVSDLFTVGRPWMRAHIRDIAFGSLLHTIQDSFAGGHATRVEGPAQGCMLPVVAEFHTYAGQDKTAHKDRDGFVRAGAAISTPRSGVLGVLRELIRMREADMSWAQVEPYFKDCVFALDANAKAATTSVAD